MNIENDVPKFDEDPVGNLDTRLARFEQREQLNTLQRTIADDEHRFAAENPDYYEALDHIRRPAMEELVTQGISEQQAQAQLAAWELQAAAQAVAAGRRPAETAYSMAKMRGFSGGRAAPEVAPDSGSAIPEFEQAMQEMFGRRG